MYRKKLFLKLFLIIITLISLMYMFNQYNSVIKLNFNQVEIDRSSARPQINYERQLVPDKLRDSGNYKDLFPVRDNEAKEIIKDKETNFEKDSI